VQQNGIIQLMKGFTQLIRDAASEWLNDNAARLSAALAYYALLSLTPLVLLILILVGAVYGEQAASQQVADQIRNFAGDEAGKAILALVRSFHRNQSTSAILGTIVLLLSASGIFGELKSSLNTIWGVVGKPGQSYTAIALQRVVLFGVVILAGLFVIAAVTVGAILSGIENSVGQILPLPGFLLNLADWLITLLITACLIGLIFRFLPDVKLRFGDVWASALGTAFLFTIGKALIGIYLGHSGVASAYGAAGSVIVVQLWVYYSACILFFGAEMAKVITCKRTGRILPRSNAIRTQE